MTPAANPAFPFSRLLIASYRLPFRLLETRKGPKPVQNSGGLVSAMLALAKRLSQPGQTESNLLWFGESSRPDEDFKRGISSASPFELHSVNIPPALDRLYYNGFCNDTIWPLFHYFPFLAVYDDSYYPAYEKANQIFADTMIPHIRPGDFVWINDYQLFLLPKMIRHKIPDVTIGFFLHIPFPSFELFRLLPKPWREGILRGLLASDLIGFHTFDYTRYFLQCVTRILDYETAVNWIYAEDRVVRADAFPIGIDFQRFALAARSIKAEHHIAKIRDQLPGIRIVFSVDRLDYTKGFLQRLEAFGEFLDRYPDHRGKVVFYMVTVPSRESIDRYKNMKKEIEATVGRINGAYGTLGWTPIIYQYRSLSFEELVACYRLSDVALITPLRDGMNLVCKEYIACQDQDAGVLILSEMAGAAAELSDALLINPFDRKEIATALDHALSMPLEEKKRRSTRMKNRLRRYDILKWAQDFFGSMEVVRLEQEKRRIKTLTLPLIREVVHRFRTATRAVLFFDYDGTLVPLQKFPEQAAPGTELYEALKQLALQANTDLVIVSGRKREVLNDWLGGLPVYLIAEHGASFRDKDGSWDEPLQAGPEWKPDILSILERFVERCTGSFIEEKTNSLAWHYRNVQPEFALARAYELKEELKAWILKNNVFQILEGHKVIEIKRTGYDKGTAALRFFQGQKADFILAIGDDRTDEDLFATLPKEAITIKVGLTQSLATYNMKNPQQVLNLLRQLVAPES